MRDFLLGRFCGYSILIGSKSIRYTVFASVRWSIERNLGVCKRETGSLLICRFYVAAINIGGSKVRNLRLSRKKKLGVRSFIEKRE